MIGNSNQVPLIKTTVSLIYVHYELKEATHPNLEEEIKSFIEAVDAGKT